MIADVNAIVSAEAQKNWEQTIESASQRPVFISHATGNIAMLSFQTLSALLSTVQYKAAELKEDDGSVTLSLDDIDIAVNAETLPAAKVALAHAIQEYAEEYYSNFETYSAAPNRRNHLPYIMKALIAKSNDEISAHIVYRKR